MNIEEAKEKIKPGWHKLIDKVYDIASLLPFAKITDITMNHSMIQIIFEKPLDKIQEYVLYCIQYRIERDSARICQECGEYGTRRIEIPSGPRLCTTCYTLQYNEYMESVSPQVTNQEPQN